MDKTNIPSQPTPTAGTPISPMNYQPPPQPSKKHLPILFIVLGLIGVALVAGIVIFKPKTTKQLPKPKIAEAVNTVPVADRPYVTLEPTDSGSDNPEHKDHPIGTEVLLKVYTVTLGATEADYELEYQAGSLLQAAIGTMNLASEQLPANRSMLLGSCSAGGKCSYNEEVAGGTLLLRLSGGSQKFAVKGEWTYQLMGEREGKFSSRDSKFRIDIGAKGLPTSTYVIIMQPMGLPEAPDGEVVAGPYHVSAGAAAVKSAEVSIRVPEDAPEMRLMGWTGTSWKEFESTLMDQALTATVDQLTTFVVLK